MGVHFDTVSMITSIGLFLIVFSIFLMLTNKKGNFYANIVFALLMICISLIVIDSGIVLYSGLYYYMPHFAKIPTIVMFLYGPLLFIYLKLLTRGRDSLHLPDLLHFIPFFIYLGFFTPLLLKDGNAKIQYVYAWLNGTITGPELIREYILFGFLVLHIIIYLAYSLWFIHRTEMGLRSIHSNDKKYFSWIKMFIYFFLFIIAITAFFLVFVSLFNFPFAIAYRILPVIATIALCFLSFRAAIQSDIHILNDPVCLQKKYEPSCQPIINIDSALPLIANAMGVKKIFMNPELSLSDLANDTGLKRNHLSFILNNHFGEKFYDFVNRYRVEEAKKILSESCEDKINFLNIGLNVGFNSKTTFNVSFKRITGMSPSEFRKSIFVSTKIGTGTCA